jgi:hypothetical protein
MEELVKKTGIPEQYLDAIVNDIRTRLPALPYIRSYLVKMAELLGLPPTLLLDRYRKEFSEKTSGGADTLPGNRFALPSGRQRFFIGAGVVAAIIVVYIISRSGFFGAPHLAIDMPPPDKETFIVSGSSTIMLAGRVDPGDKLFINGQEVATGEDGIFSKEYQLLPELNIIEFTTKRFLGRELTVRRQVYYEEPTSTPALRTPKKEPAPEPPPEDLELPAEAPLP